MIVQVAVKDEGKSVTFYNSEYWDSLGDRKWIWGIICLSFECY